MTDAKPLTDKEIDDFRIMVRKGHTGFYDERERLLATIDALKDERDSLTLERNRIRSAQG